ncbi:MAG TPA: hypothetical protein PLD59_02315 [Tepidisphaeraceae bacterium]|nr:hypothetical protein [Tepidisphaeraceae bacterium]
MNRSGRALIFSSGALTVGVWAGFASADTVILSDDFNRSAGVNAAGNAGGISTWGMNNNALGGTEIISYKNRNTAIGTSTEQQFVDGNLGRLRLGHGVVDFDLLTIPQVLQNGFSASFDFQRGGSGYIAFAVGMTPAEIEAHPQNNARIGVPFATNIPETDFGFLFRPPTGGQGQSEIWKGGTQITGPLGLFNPTGITGSPTTLLNSAVARFVPATAGQWDTGATINLELTINGAATPQYTTTFTSDGSGLGYFGFHSNSGSGVAQAGIDNFTISALGPVVTTNAWAVDASGDWSLGTNWTAGASPNAVSATALLGGVISSPRTATLDEPVTLGHLTFDNANAYTIAGSHTLSIQTSSGPGSIGLALGNHSITAPLQIKSNTVLGGPGTLKVASLGVDAATQLDLGDRSLVVDYTGVSPRAALEALVASGFAAGANNGDGINTSAGSSSRRLGIAEAGETPFLAAGTFAGQTVDSTTLIIRYTLPGDANLSGGVSLDDFTSLAAGFGSAGRWSAGDFNYDGNVNLDDFTALAANFGASLPADVARRAVPEPTMLAVPLAMLVMSVRRRRNG